MRIPRCRSRVGGVVRRSSFRRRPPLRAQQPSTPRFDPAAYEQTSADIPMRDGVTLHTEIFRPRGAAGAAADSLHQDTVRRRQRARRSLRLVPAARRRRVHLRLPGHPRAVPERRDVRHAAPARAGRRRRRQAIDEITDTDDTIDWLLANVPGNNGRVGMLGMSYDGWTAAMGMLDPHPALSAVSPQASPADMFLGDDFHHNGAFRLSYGFEYAWLTEATRENSDFDFDRHDTYEWYLGVGPLSNIQKQVLKDKVLPTWSDFGAHPNYDAFWRRQAMRPYLTRVTMPTLNVAGWWDQEDFYGPVTIYDELEKHDTREPELPRRRPVEPRRVERRPGQKLGKIDFGSPTGEYFRRKIEAPFFAYYLKDEGRLEPARGHGLRVRQQPLAHVRRAGRRARRTTQALYFHAGGKLVVHAAHRRRGIHGRPLRQRPGAPGPLPPPADRADLLPEGLGLVHLAARGPALRARAARRAELGDRAAHRRRRASPDGSPPSSSPAPRGRTPTGS